MNLNALLRDVPIRRKLTLIVILAAGTALLFATVASMTQQWLIARFQLAKSISSQAQIIAENSAAALVFRDPKSATLTLRALAAVDNIEFATILDKDGKPFASYTRAGIKSPFAQIPPDEVLYSPEMTYVDVFQPVILGGERVGTLRMHSSMSPIYATMAWSMAGLLASVLGGLGLAMVMMYRLHPTITRPIGELVQLMDKIADEKNYAVRAGLHGKDELGMLANGFNDMLTKIQRRDDALAQRTLRLMEAQRIAHLGNWEWDVINNTLSWSDEIYRIFKLNPGRAGATYEEFLTVVHPEDRQYVDSQMHEALDQSRPYSIDHRIQLSDGTVRYVHAQAEVIRDNDGRATKMVGTTQDVTGYAKSQKELEWKSSVLSAQQEATPDAILLVDDKIRIVSYNRHFIDLWGIPEELVKAGVDQPVLQTVMQQVKDPEVFLARVEYLYEHREEKSHEELLLKDGRVIDRDSFPVAGTDGKYLGRVWYFRDISARKQAEEKIRKLNQELEHKVKQLLDAQDELVRKEKLAVLGQVAGSVGHELRNPLGVMSNAVYFLQTVLSDADDIIKEYLGIIKGEIAASEHIVSDLLDSVRTKPPLLETVEIVRLIEEALSKCTIPPSVTVKLDIPVKISPLQVDAMQIHQVFRNLISNGVEAMPEGGTLEIRATENTSTKKVTISVRDTGIGMTPEQLSKLFQPLFTTKARGIGLGLVVVKNLTQANGGSVDVESVPGAGSIFAVTLPCSGMVGETVL